MTLRSRRHLLGGAAQRRRRAASWWPPRCRWRLRRVPAAARPWPAAAASSTSCLRMRPPTPVPRSVERSTPCSVASLRTSGVTYAVAAAARRRWTCSWAGVAAAGWAGATAGRAAAAGCCWAGACCCAALLLGVPAAACGCLRCGDQRGRRGLLLRRLLLLRLLLLLLLCGCSCSLVLLLAAAARLLLPPPEPPPITASSAPTATVSSSPTTILVSTPDGGRGDLGVDLVGGDLEQWLVGVDLVALLLEPAGDGALGHALAERGHGDRRAAAAGRHRRRRPPPGCWAGRPAAGGCSLLTRPAPRCCGAACSCCPESCWSWRAVPARRPACCGCPRPAGWPPSRPAAVAGTVADDRELGADRDGLVLADHDLLQHAGRRARGSRCRPCRWRPRAAARRR